jgi:hypothetical protein
MRALDYLPKLNKHWHAQTKQETDNVCNHRPTEMNFHSKGDCETRNQKFKRKRFEFHFAVYAHKRKVK